MKFPWTKPVPPVPTPHDIARTELQQAEKDLLAAEKDAEHFSHQVQLHKARIIRLKAHVAKAGNSDA